MELSVKDRILNLARFLKRRIGIHVKTFRNVFLLAADRFIALFATIVGSFLGASSFTQDSAVAKWIYSSDFIQFFNVARLVKDPLIFYVILLLALALISLWVAKYWSRSDAVSYSRIVTQDIDTTYIIQKTCEECLKIINALEGKNKREIYKTLKKVNQKMEIIKEVKIHIAKRLNLSPRNCCDYILKFNPEIYRDRMMKKAMNQIEELGPEEIDEIDKYSRQCKAHLRELSQTSLDLDHVAEMFSAYPSMVQFHHFLNILEKIQENSEYHEGVREQKLLYTLQIAYHHGIILNKLIALCVAGTRYYAGDDKGKKALLERGLNYLLLPGTGDGDGKADYYDPQDRLENRALSHEEFKEWKKTTFHLIRGLFTEITELFYDKLEELLTGEFAMIYDHKQEEVEKNGLYVVIKNYSRLNRTALRRVLGKKKFSNATIFILTGYSEESDFGSKLVHHQLLNEHFEDKFQESEEGHPLYKNTDEGFENRVIQGNAEMLFNRGIKDKTKVLYIVNSEGLIRDHEIATLESIELQQKLVKHFGKRNIKFYALNSAYKVLIKDMQISGERKKRIDDLSKYVPTHDWEDYYIWRNVEVLQNQKNSAGDPLRPTETFSS